VELEVSNILGRTYNNLTTNYIKMLRKTITPERMKDVGLMTEIPPIQNLRMQGEQEEEAKQTTKKPRHQFTTATSFQQIRSTSSASSKDDDLGFDDSCVQTDETRFQSQIHVIMSSKKSIKTKFVKDVGTYSTRPLMLPGSGAQNDQEQDDEPPAEEFKLDTVKLANKLVSHFNQLSGQIFTLQANLYQLLTYKPRRIFRYLSRQFQNRIQS
jgi:hypothetical protein